MQRAERVIRFFSRTYDENTRQGSFKEIKVERPSTPHYEGGGVETIDYQFAKLSDIEFVGHCKACVLKYVSREACKGGTEDLEKAADYLRWAIECRNGEPLT